MVETIFSGELGQAILVFLLVFVVVFAVLQKSRVFGEGKKQIDALVALAMGLIVVSVGYATHIISSLIPFMAVSLVIILVFMILIGSMYKEGSFDMPGWVKMGFGIVVFIALVIAVLYFTGAWDYLYDRFVGGEGSTLLTNIIFIAVIGGAIALVLSGGKGGGKKDDKH